MYNLPSGINEVVTYFKIAIDKSGGGVYYRFWFVYIIIATIITLILVMSSFISMCRRYQLVANQGDEVVFKKSENSKY